MVRKILRYSRDQPRAALNFELKMIVLLRIKELPKGVQNMLKKFFSRVKKGIDHHVPRTTKINKVLEIG